MLGSRDLCRVHNSKGKGGLSRAGRGSVAFFFIFLWLAQEDT